MRWEVVFLAVLFSTAGCLGLGEEEIEPASDEARDPASNATNATENTTSFRFTETAHQGTITGASTPLAAANTPDSDTVLEVEIGEAPVKIAFLVAPEGGPVQMLIASPDCEPNSGCETSVHAEDHADAVWNTTDPESGTWTLRFFYGETGVGEVDWELKQLAKLPAQ